jgi:hypothetical protein
VSSNGINQIVASSHVRRPRTGTISESFENRQRVNDSSLNQNGIKISHRSRGLPNNVENESIKMPRLGRGFIVLEDDFNKVMKGGSNDRGAEDCRARSWSVLDCVEAKDTGDVKPVCELQWGVWIDVGDSVNSIP